MDGERGDRQKNAAADSGPPARRAQESTGVDRLYAHFHRVLGELLTELAQLPGVEWTNGVAGHEIRPDGQRNTYRPALYPVPDAAPYEAPLRQLATIQQDLLALTGSARPGRNLLGPLLLRGVHHVRLSRHRGQTGRTVTRRQALARLAELYAQSRSNLRKFERYATGHDPRREALERETRALADALEAVRNAPEERLRESYRYEVVRPYVYFEDGAAQQLHMREHGLILEGGAVSISWQQGPRRPRSDRVAIQPLALAGNLSFYPLSAWEAAKAGK